MREVLARSGRPRRNAKLGLYLLLWAACSSGACKRASTRDESSAPPANPAAAAAPAASPPSAGGGSAVGPGHAGFHSGFERAPLLASSTPSCRATQLSGQVRTARAALSVGALVGGEDWLDLAPGARLSLKHTQSAREVELRGPAHVLACRSGREQFLLTQGQLSTTSGLGARPGAEVLIATPLGAVRYGDAALDVEVSATRLRVVAHKGYAWVMPEAVAAGFHNPLRGPEGKVELRGAPADPRARVEACKAAAERAEGSARRVTTRATGDLPSLGERAAVNARDRAAARAACAMAAAAVGLVKDASQEHALSSDLARWDGLWQAAPH